MKTRTILGLVVLAGAGVAARTFPQNSFRGVPVMWPWSTTTVTLYFSDGRFMVPVSRQMPRKTDVPRATLQALLDGPTPQSGLKNPVPDGVEIRSFELVEGEARIDLSSVFLGPSSHTHAAAMAMIETMTALSGVRSVSLRVEGTPLVDSASRVPLVYYGSANGLVAVPVSAKSPRAALTTYLSGPADRALTGLPSDVRVLSFEHDPDHGSLSLNFSYTPSVRTLALERPDRMRTALLGLIATLTEFPSVRTVRLDFDGQARLGLGECSDLLRTDQPRPELLNDERVIGR